MNRPFYYMFQYITENITKIYDLNFIQIRTVQNLKDYFFSHIARRNKK
jgi:hypothetical protein